MIHSYPWYFDDWFSSETRLMMTAEERGIYRDLLDRCYRDGSLPTDHLALMRLAAVTEKEFKRSWRKVSTKFVIVDGRLHHERVDAELVRLSNFREERSQAGSNGAKKRWQKYRQIHSSANGIANSSAIADDMANGCPSSTTSSTTSSASTSTEDPPAAEVAWVREVLCDYAAQCGVNLGSPPDDAICLQVLKLGDSHRLNPAIRAMFDAGKRPAKSWAFFPTVLPQFLSQVSHGSSS